MIRGKITSSGMQHVGDPSGSRRSLKDALQSCKDLHKWTVPMITANDIEICRHPDGSPIELGRGGFCKASPSRLIWLRLHAIWLSPCWLMHKCWWRQYLVATVSVGDNV